MTHVKPRRLDRLKTRAKRTMGKNLLSIMLMPVTHDRLNFRMETIVKASHPNG